MPDFKVKVRFELTGHFIISAPGREEGREMVHKQCGLLPIRVFSTLPDDVVDWEFPAHPDKIIIRVDRAAGMDKALNPRGKTNPVCSKAMTYKRFRKVAGEGMLTGGKGDSEVREVYKAIKPFMENKKLDKTEVMRFGWKVYQETH